MSKYSFTHTLNEWLDTWSTVESCVREDLEELNRKGFDVRRCEIRKESDDAGMGFLHVSLFGWDREGQ